MFNQLITFNSLFFKSIDFYIFIVNCKLTTVYIYKLLTLITNTFEILDSLKNTLSMIKKQFNQLTK